MHLDPQVKPLLCRGGWAYYSYYSLCREMHALGAVRQVRLVCVGVCGCGIGEGLALEWELDVSRLRLMFCQQVATDCPYVVAALRCCCWKGPACACASCSDNSLASSHSRGA